MSEGASSSSNRAAVRGRGRPRGRPPGRGRPRSRGTIGTYTSVAQTHRASQREIIVVDDDSSDDDGPPGTLFDDPFDVKVRRAEDYHSLECPRYVFLLTSLAGAHRSQSCEDLYVYPYQWYCGHSFCGQCMIEVSADALVLCQITLTCSTAEQLPHMWHAYSPLPTTHPKLEPQPCR